MWFCTGWKFIQCTQNSLDLPDLSCKFWKMHSKWCDKEWPLPFIYFYMTHYINVPIHLCLKLCHVYYSGMACTGKCFILDAKYIPNIRKMCSALWIFMDIHVVLGPHRTLKNLQKVIFKGTNSLRLTLLYFLRVFSNYHHLPQTILVEQIPPHYKDSIMRLIGKFFHYFNVECMVCIILYEIARQGPLRLVL